MHEERSSVGAVLVGVLYCVLLFSKSEAGWTVKIFLQSSRTWQCSDGDVTERLLISGSAASSCCECAHNCPKEVPCPSECPCPHPHPPPRLCRSSSLTPSSWKGLKLPPLYHHYDVNEKQHRPCTCACFAPAALPLSSYRRRQH